MNLPGRHRPAAEKIKADYDKVVREYYLEDGKALISCKVRGMDDIISHYSVKNRENMNPELSAYLDDNIFYLPLEHLHRLVKIQLSKRLYELAAGADVSCYQHCLSGIVGALTGYRGELSVHLLHIVAAILLQLVIVATEGRGVDDIRTR